MNKKPNDKIMNGNFKEPQQSKILPHAETPFHVRDMMTCARECGQQLAEHEWNNFTNFMAKQFGDKEYAGNDFLSAMSTFAAYFVSTWVILMKMVIADKDDTAITREEMITTLFDGVNTIIKTARISNGKDTQGSC